MKPDALVRNRWMIAVRGGLAVAFGMAITLWPNMTLSAMVALFGLYAILDGAWTVAAGARVSMQRLEGWPVMLQGVAGVTLGAVALTWPSVPRHLVYLLAAWGVATGALEILAALSRPARGARFWLLVTGGLSSLFLATLIVLLPHAQLDVVARIVAAYAQVFGVVMLVTAIRFSGDRPAPRYAPAPR
jgi:uncharacterized membrane protein HdeD (DUF308 family)